VTATGSTSAAVTAIAQKPTATTMYCGLATEMSEDWPASSSYGKPYCLPPMEFWCQNSA
jgi:hypothetical protein